MFLFFSLLIFLVKETIEPRLALAILTGSLIILAKGMIGIPPLVVDKAIILSK